MSMHAIVQDRYGDIDQLSLRELPRPEPAADQVLVRVRAAGVNDWDLGILRGKPLFMRFFLGWRRPSVRVMGCEVAGEVVACGTGAGNFKPGDRVYGDLSASGFGAYAEYLCTSESSLRHMPSRLSFEQAVAIPHAGLLAWQGLMQIGRLQPGQSILINGAGGGVGSLGVQLAKLRQARVTGIDSGDKLDFMRLLGFDEVIDYRQQDFSHGEKRYDIILDNKTQRSPFALSRALKPGGIYISIGGSMPRVFQCALLAPWFRRRHDKRFKVLGLKPNQELDRLTGLIDAGKLIPAIDKRFPLAQVPEAIAYFRSARHTGKVIVSVPD